MVAAENMAPRHQVILYLPIDDLAEEEPVKKTADPLP